MWRGATFRRASICSGRKLLTPTVRITPFFVQEKQRFRRLFDRRFRVRPMDLIKIDPVGPQAAQALLDFLQDPLARCVAPPHAPSRVPLESGFCRDYHPVSVAGFREGFSDDFFRPAEPVEGGRVDQVPRSMARSRASATSDSSIPSHIHPLVPIPIRETSSSDVPRRAYCLAIPPLAALFSN